MNNQRSLKEIEEIIRDLTSKRDELSNRIAAAPVGQDVSALMAARNWYNRVLDVYAIYNED